MDTMTASCVSRLHSRLPASCQNCTEHPGCLAPPTPPLSRLIGWPHNVGPFSGHPSGPPSLVPHSGVPGWGAQILARFLAPDPGPLFKARMRPSSSIPSDPVPRMGPVRCTDGAGRSPLPMPAQRTYSLILLVSDSMVTDPFPRPRSFGRVAFSSFSTEMRAHRCPNFS